MNKGLYYVKTGFIMAKASVYGVVGLAATWVALAGIYIQDACTCGVDRCADQRDSLKKKAANEKKD